MAHTKKAETSEYEVKPLNLLAFPRDFTPICELSGERASVQLVTEFGSMYYASELAAEQAWHGIIKKIAHLLTPLMSAAPIVVASDERAKRATNLILSKRSIIEFCKSEASKLLSVHKYNLVIPAAVQAIKLCRDIDGDRSIGLVEPYLQMSQSFLGLQELNKAEEYVSQASWIVLNTPECSDHLRSKLYLLSGRVKAGKGNFNDAKIEFASGIYHASRAYGAESIATSFGYYRIGDVFLVLGSPEIALDFYDKVVDIWYKYLTTLYTSEQEKRLMIIRSSTSNPNDLEVPSSTASLETLSQEELSEGKNQLEQILGNRSRLLGDQHITIGEAQYTIGLFNYFLLNSEDTAQSMIQLAFDRYVTAYGNEHPATQHVSSVLQLVSSPSSF